MRLYIVLEGNRESYIYREWIKYILPSYSEIYSVNQVLENNDNVYYMLCGYGYPLCYSSLINAIKDIKEYPLFDYLIFIGDTEDLSIEKRLDVINKKIDIVDKTVSNKLKILLQKFCIETWLLGNRKIYKTKHGKDDLKLLQDLYNVKTNDPENMNISVLSTRLKDKYDINTTAQYHKLYLKKLVSVVTKERINTTSIEKSSKYFGEKAYYDQLVARMNRTGHIKTFKDFYDFFILL